MTFITGTSTAAANLCRALGLDPAVTVSITLEVHVSELVRVQVEQVVPAERIEALTTELRRFVLVDEKAAQVPEGGESS